MTPSAGRRDLHPFELVKREPAITVAEKAQAGVVCPHSDDSGVMAALPAKIPHRPDLPAMAAAAKAMTGWRRAGLNGTPPA